MIVNPIVILLRGTIFLNKTIEYTKENQSLYAELLSNSNINPLPMAPQLNSVSNVPWQIANKDCAIIFLPNKIDIIQRLTGKRTDLELSFLKFCKNIFKTILEKSDSVATRIAFAPTYVYDGDVSNENIVSELWLSILKDIKVGDLSKEDINISYLLRKDWSPSDNTSSVLVNLSHKWQDGTKTFTDGKTERCIILELDVNTAPSKENTFKIDEISDFYDWAINNVDDIMNKY